MLLYAQDEIGYVSEGAIQETCEAARYLRTLEVRSVLSYYSMLRTKPAGKYNVRRCARISTPLRGGYEILDHCKAKLASGTSRRRPMACSRLKRWSALGACCWAPAMQA